MEDRDYQNYIEVYNVVTSPLQAPDLMIYLRKSLPRLKEQIRKRGRDYEQDMPEDYLANLNRYYDDWIGNYNIGKKLVIESDALDFVANPRDFEEICSLVMGCLDQRDLFISETAANQGTVMTAFAPIKQPVEAPFSASV